jgi:hypothetical protein
LSYIAAHPLVAVLADGYEQDWASLWWVDADATGPVDMVGPLRLLARRYPQYRASPRRAW